MTIVQMVCAYTALVGCLGLMLGAMVWLGAEVWRERAVLLGAVTGRVVDRVERQLAGRRLVVRTASAGAIILVARFLAAQLPGAT